MLGSKLITQASLLKRYFSLSTTSCKGSRAFSEDEIRQLPKILQRFLPRSAVAYNIVQLHLQNRHNKNHLKAKFYSCNPLNFKGPIFLVCFLEKTYEEPEIVVFTSDPSGGSTEAVNQFEKLINWKECNTFSAFNGPLSEKAKEICLRKGKLVEATTVRCKFNVMDWNKIDENYLKKQDEMLSKNKNIRVGPLRREDAKVVVAQWDFAREDSKTEIMDLIDKTVTCGLYVGSELACWMVLNQIGTMSALYTMGHHRGKGFAEVVARNVTKRTKEIGLIPSAEMVLSNVGSYALFAKIGYECPFESQWLCYSPK